MHDANNLNKTVALSQQLDFIVPQDHFLQSLKQILIYFISSVESIQDESDMPGKSKDLVISSCEVG